MKLSVSVPEDRCNIVIAKNNSRNSKKKALLFCIWNLLLLRCRSYWFNLLVTIKVRREREREFVLLKPFCSLVQFLDISASAVQSCGLFMLELDIFYSVLGYGPNGCLWQVHVIGGEHELLSIPYRCIGLLNQSRMQG